ncbi:Enoyl-CoA delta isomerase [Trichinella pseudospiralis]
MNVSAYYGWIEREYFCNGNYLNNLLVKPSDRAKMAADAKLLLRDFDGTFIDYPEILLAAANSGGDHFKVIAAMTEIHNIVKRHTTELAMEEKKNFPGD